MFSFIVASLTGLAVTLGAVVIVIATWPRKIRDDVMMQVVGDASYVGRVPLSKGERR